MPCTWHGPKRLESRGGGFGTKDKLGGKTTGLVVWLVNVPLVAVGRPAAKRLNGGVGRANKGCPRSRATTEGVAGKTGFGKTQVGEEATESGEHPGAREWACTVKDEERSGGWSANADGLER